MERTGRIKGAQIVPHTSKDMEERDKLAGIKGCFYIHAIDKKRRVIEEAAMC